MIESVDVLGKRYTVVVKTEMADYGECKSDECLIEIGSHQCAAQQRDTLLHEVIHAIEHELDVTVTEKAVRMLGTGLLAVLRHNPALAAYLTAD